MFSLVGDVVTRAAGESNFREVFQTLFHIRTRVSLFFKGMLVLKQQLVGYDTCSPHICFLHIIRVTYESKGTYFSISKILEDLLGWCV